MHEFFDLFVIGEAEEVILEIIDIYRQSKSRFKAGKINKEELLIAFSNVEGVYVPSLYEVSYNSEGKIEEFRPKLAGIPLKIKKRFIKDLDSAYFPLDWLIPYIQIVHDRITLEIMRGCPNTCRFCQARYQYFPFRQRGIKNILDLASSTYKRTGYEEISLCGLSVSDYLGIEELTRLLINLFKDNAVSVSLPSLKPKTLVGNLSALIATIKKTGLTFAPEAATEKLRGILAKDFDIQHFFQTLKEAYLAGYQHVKLYFMIGLPCEQEKDLDSILDFAFQVSELSRKINKKAAQVNISINPLIPKPHTPFQWLQMESIENIKYKQDYLKKKIKNRRFRLSLRNPYMSLLEGILSRGDRRLSRVIIEAFHKGAKFDAWDNYFIFEKWQDAFWECQIDPDFYLRVRSKDEILPWDFLEVGISKEAILKDADKIVAIE
jgi:radical SAM family uncharacterized protein